VTVLLSRLLGTTRVTRGQVAGVVIGFGGVAVVTVGSEAATTARLVGVLWLLAAAVAWAVGLQLTKRRAGGGDPLAFVTWQLALGAPVLFALAWWMEGLVAAWTPALLVAVLWSGALSKGVGSVLQYLTTGWSSPVQSSLTAFLVPIVAFGLAVPLLGARLGLEHLLGAGLVTLGVTLVRREGGGPAAIRAAPAAGSVPEAPVGPS